MPILISEKSGLFELLPEEPSPVKNMSGMKFWSFKNAGKFIKIRKLENQSYCAELMTFHFNNDDKIIFPEKPQPYTLIFVFGNSITLYLPSGYKRELHDRASNLFYSPETPYKIQFKKEQDYLLIFIHYSNTFVSSNLEEQAQDIRLKWENQPPNLYYSKSRIVTWGMMEYLSMLLLSSTVISDDEILCNELARVILMDFLLESDISFQPGNLRSENLITFYQERDRAVEAATTSSSISKILSISQIRNVPLFRKRLNQLYNLNIREFITETKMAKAITLLKDSTLSIKEVASQTGFSNSLYFSRVFSHFFHMPPKAYRSRST